MPPPGLGSVIVFMSTVFALWAGVNDGLAALVIVQAGVFAEASRQLVRYDVPSVSQHNY